MTASEICKDGQGSILIWNHTEVSRNVCLRSKHLLCWPTTEVGINSAWAMQEVQGNDDNNDRSTYFMCMNLCFACWRSEDGVRSLERLWATTWVLKTESKTSVRAAGALNCWVFSLEPKLLTKFLTKMKTNCSNLWEKGRKWFTSVKNQARPHAVNG